VRRSSNSTSFSPLWTRAWDGEGPDEVLAALDDKPDDSGPGRLASQPVGLARDRSTGLVIDNERSTVRYRPALHDGPGSPSRNGAVELPTVRCNAISRDDLSSALRVNDAALAIRFQRRFDASFLVGRQRTLIVCSFNGAPTVT
jgi:hypothetical protein